jgi:hypothetical protein
MAILELQGMQPSRGRGDDHGAGSNLSLLLCDSMISIALCL